MEKLDRITQDPGVMGGRPCIRGMRVTGSTIRDLLTDYPYLEDMDIRQALLYGAWRAEEREIDFAT